MFSSFKSIPPAISETASCGIIQHCRCNRCALQQRFDSLPLRFCFLSQIYFSFARYLFLLFAQSKVGNLVFNPGASLAVEIPAKLLIANASSADNGGAAAAATIDVAEKMNMMIEQMGAMQKEMDGMKAENAALKDQIAELGVGGASGNPVTDTVVRLSCEGLGEAPPGFKCPTKVHPDSMVIIDVDGLRALKFTSAIQGPLTIQNVAAGFDLTEYVQNLQHVAGDITVENNAGLKTAQFSALVRVDGSITFQGNPAATTLEFPLLDIKNTTVSDDGDTFVVSKNLKLDSVAVKDFTHLYGKVFIDSNPLLESFQFATAVEVLASGSSFLIESNHRLQSVLLPALTTMADGAKISVQSNNVLESISLPGLKTMANETKVTVNENRVLDSVSFPAMEKCADFTFTAAPANSTVYFPLLEVITGTMVITIEGGHVTLPMLSNAASGGLVGKMKIVSNSQTEVGAMRVSWPVEVQNAFASNPEFVSAFGPSAIKWVVQKSGTYRISVAGGAGGGHRAIPTCPMMANCCNPPSNGQCRNPIMGGRGANIAISLLLEKGEVLDLAPGQMGCSHDWHRTGTQWCGGGGTFVSIGTRNTPLVVAGGGAAIGHNGGTTQGITYKVGKDAELSQDGGSGDGGGTPYWARNDKNGIAWDDSFTPKHGIGGSDAISCYPACTTRCEPILTADNIPSGSISEMYRSCKHYSHQCHGCLPPARGYASFKSCGYCAASEKKGGISCENGEYTMDCTHAGNGYSGGGDEMGTFILSGTAGVYEGKGGGGSYYQHPDSTVLSATVDNTGPGSILIEAL